MTPEEFQEEQWKLATVEQQIVLSTQYAQAVMTENRLLSRKLKAVQEQLNMVSVVSTSRALDRDVALEMVKWWRRACFVCVWIATFSTVAAVVLLCIVTCAPAHSAEIVKFYDGAWRQDVPYSVLKKGGTLTAGKLTLKG